MDPDPVYQQVRAHYTRVGLLQTILDALAASGKDPDHLAATDLAPVDEFHIGGLVATQELAARLDLNEHMHVLDAGCGLGGAARFLAETYRCQVTGIDLNNDYSQAAGELARRAGLDGKVIFQTGSIVEMPFEDGQFDVVWTQHASMNIAPKERLYAEIWRVLKPGGQFALYDVLAGPVERVHFPVPWARTPEISFLISPERLRQVLEQAGFQVKSWSDTSAAGLAFFQKIQARIAQNGLPPVGLHLLLGPDFPTMLENITRNLAEDRIRVVQVVALKNEPAS